MRLLIGRSQDVARFVADLIPRCRERGFGNCSAIGVLDADNRLVGGMVYHDWDPGAGVIEFSGAAVSPRWLTRPVLHRLFSYPFDELGCQLVATRNSARNTRLHRQLKAYGFERFDIPRLFGRDEDAVVWTLTVEGWRANRFNRRDAVEQAQSADAA